MLSRSLGVPSRYTGDGVAPAASWGRGHGPPAAIDMHPADDVLDHLIIGGALPVAVSCHTPITSKRPACPGISSVQAQLNGSPFDPPDADVAGPSFGNLNGHVKLGEESLLSISCATSYTAFVMDRREFLLLKTRSKPKHLELSCKWLYEQCVDSQITPTVFDSEAMRRVFDDLDTRLRGVETVRVTNMNWLTGDLRLEFGSLMRAFRSRGGKVAIER